MRHCHTASTGTQGLPTHVGHADFSSSDVGSYIAGLFILDNTTIASVVNPTTVTISQDATRSTTNSPVVICRIP
jgi:hypothetical protein